MEINVLKGNWERGRELGVNSKGSHFNINTVQGGREGGFNTDFSTRYQNQILDIHTDTLIVGHNRFISCLPGPPISLYVDLGPGVERSG